MLSTVGGPRKASYLCFLALIACAAALHLGPMVLAGLFSYLLLDMSHRRLSQAMRPFYARWTSCAIFLVAGSAIGWVFWEFLRQALSSMPRIVANALPKVIEMTDHYGFDLPFETLEQVREAFLAAVKENALAVTRMTGLYTKRFFHVLAGVIIAVLCFFGESEPARGASLYDVLRAEVHDRFRTFMLSFEKVFGAQIIISGINTTITAIFLATAGIPHMAFLVPATFILGLLPLIGGILSNTLIVSSALTVSPSMASIALIFLIVIHKAEYFLNSRIVGGSIDSPMWLTLIGILVGELIMGVPGIILAPAILHYIRVELQAIPAPPHESRPL
ncbi:MAG: AI-2E family transporter [Elusimicrobia bacterium]|nr:AI-2E family transporter [Elusimicrobiota bacterium]